jgi:hypothetical protein
LKTKFIFCTIALVALAGCVKRPPPVDFEKEYLEEKATYEPNIGKTYWLRGGTFLCPRSTTGVIDCTSIPVGTKLQLDGIERGITSDAHYHVVLEDGRTGYISAFDLVRFGTDVVPRRLQPPASVVATPRIGMSAKQVRATCRGEPDRVDRRETARGVTERDVYGKSRHVLLHNGIVTSVQISGTLRLADGVLPFQA